MTDPGNLIDQPFYQGLFSAAFLMGATLWQAGCAQATPVPIVVAFLWCCFAASVEVLPFAAA